MSHFTKLNKQVSCIKLVYVCFMRAKFKNIRSIRATKITLIDPCKFSSLGSGFGGAGLVGVSQGVAFCIGLGLGSG